ncbi:MAG: DUF3987 domain-containing protein [Bacteroidaceae bacterium]|nr:DUF3987 domain-containing protein [Bacteroidaceae bacterium]
MKKIKTTLENGVARTTVRPATPPATSASHSVNSATVPSSPSLYEGVPYTSIVRAWLAQRGIEGDVAEGARNTTLYQLARDLRYICDFNVDRMLAVLPHWGLSDDEARGAMQSATSSPRGTQMPQGVQAIIDQLKKSAAAEEEEEPTDRNPLPATLPPLFDVIARRYRMFPKTAVLAALPAVGTLLSQLRARYADGRVQSPIFFTVVQAPQASGKSFARELSDWLLEPVKANDALERQKEQEYKEKARKAKNAKEQPDDPRAIVRCLPATVSNAVLLKRADYAHELALFTFAEEIDTIVRSNKSGSWAQKNDIYRMAFDGAEWGQDYMAENSYAAVVRLHYNLLFLGTPLAVSGFFKRVEDGMASRFIVCHLPDNRGEALHKDAPLSIGARNRVAAMVKRAFEEGSQKEEIALSLPKTLAALDKWQMERIAEFDRDPDNFALDILRRRSAVIGFRAAMLAWWLCDRRETQAVVDFALWVASEVLGQQLVHFGEDMNRIERESLEKMKNLENKARSGRNGRLLASLPDAFTKADVIVARKRMGFEGDVSYVISRWLRRGLIAESGMDKYSYTKIEKN